MGPYLAALHRHASLINQNPSSDLLEAKMNSQTLIPDDTQPFEIIYNVKWLDLLFRNNDRGPHNLSKPHFEVNLNSPASPCPSVEGLRTVVAVRPEELLAAEQLVRRRYAWRGYRLAPTQDLGMASLGAEGRRTTLLAEDCGQLLGTVTVRPDSPQGLLAEQTYAAEVEGLRRKGHRIAEVVKLAVEEGANWKAILGALVHSTYFLTRFVHALTDVLIEVNPRHVRFYQGILGFVVAATERLCSRVGAPAVLMQLDLQQFGQRLQLSAM